MKHPSLVSIRNPLLVVTIFVVLIQMNMAFAVVLQERREFDSNSASSAELAFAGLFALCFGPFLALAPRYWPEGVLSQVRIELLLSFLYWIFCFGGSSALSSQLTFQETSPDPFVRSGTIALVILSWAATVLFGAFFSITAALFIRRWAAWEDGVSRLNARVIWEEGWNGGIMMRRNMDEGWKADASPARNSLGTSRRQSRISATIQRTASRLQGDATPTQRGIVIPPVVISEVGELINIEEGKGKGKEDGAGLIVIREA
ncbi:hypothetical protein T439DRAFT_378529 [Meredithblackwellia eburnea MCA 4105]